MIETSCIVYPAPLRILHWIVAALVLAVWPLGLSLKYIKDEVKLDFYLIHESFGFLVLWLMLLRVGLRLSSTVPAVEGPPMQKIAANTVHIFLYLCLIVMPLSGFLATNAHGFPLSLFGILPVWSPIDKSPDLAPIFSAVHATTAWIIVALVATHIAAALFHHVIKRDGTLFRIL